MPGVDDDVADLYGLPREKFTDARNALARELRERGEREASEQVRGLRKPTVAAWAANQVARRHRKDVNALLSAGDDLRSAHEALVSGGGGEDVAEAAAAERAAVRTLVGRARKLGLSDAVLERVAETLHAAAGDEELREELRRGAVTRERTPAMFGGLAAGAPAPGGRSARTARKPAKKPKSGADRADRERRDKREREKRERQARERQERLKAARAELRRLRAEHGRSRRALDAVERRLSRARDELSAREEEADAAREREAEAQRALAERESEVERLEEGA